MLARLEIRGFALIREADLDLDAGFNVLTGATGVGKTLVLAALELLLGGRARSDRLSADGASVSGLFHLDEETARDVETLIDDRAGDSIVDGELLLRRDIDGSGRNRCRINGTTVTVAILRTVGERLVDIHGQNEHQSLLRPREQLAALDRFAGLDGDREEFARLREELAEDTDRRRALTGGRDERESRLDWLNHVVDEIVELSPRAGERAELELECRRLREAEHIGAALARHHESLHEAEGSMTDLLAAALRELGEVAEIDPRLAPVVEELAGARVTIEEAAATLRSCAEGATADPARLEEVEERIDALSDLIRKHRVSDEAELLEVVDRASEEISNLQTDETDLSGLDERIAKQREELARRGAALTKARLAGGEKLAREVALEIEDLGMKDTRLSFAHVPPPGDADLLEASGPSGVGRVELRVATHASAEPGPLQRIASGGELARVMLALKSRLAQADRIPVLVFDEVDANIGGRLGSVVGTKIAGLARRRQVISVTHLPQIAAFAERHLKVEKRTDDTTAATSIVVLGGDARRDEIAEMLGGPTETARAQAVALLDEAARSAVPEVQDDPGEAA